MTVTILSSPTQEVRIGPDLPFVIIGERINPTGRKLLAAEMAAGDYFTRGKGCARAGSGGRTHAGRERRYPDWLTSLPFWPQAIKIVQATVDVPLSIDSSIVKALESGLAAYQGKALVNSVTGEEERLEIVLPLIKKYDAAVIAISNDETGISENPEVRLAVARKIIERAQDHGIKKENVLIDPLVMPIGAMRYAGRQVFEIVRRCRDELGVNTCCGASNVSFGLPNRGPLNGTFLAMAIGAGLTSAITNPIEEHIKTAILAADVMTGNDENCLNLDRRQPPGGKRCGSGGR